MKKIYWHEDGSESFLGRLYPIFTVFRDYPKKEFILTMWKSPRHKPRNIRVDSIEQGKRIALKILMLEKGGHR